MKNKILFITFILIIFLGIAVFIFNPSKKEVVTPSPVASFPNNTTNDYNNFYNLIPGKSTLSDFKRVNGEPIRTNIVENSEYLYYRAPFDNENPVLLKNNILIYASEYVFGNYRGTYSDFTKAYGSPDKVLYDRYQFPWKAFFGYGIAVQESAGQIARIIYFVPDDQSLFYDTVFKDFNLSETPTGLVAE